ncbi:MAG: V-type ATP synthase subunit D [Clostridiales bacterium]|nr:V-type ATP synthase subunit D [Clostridiales bacterium]
MAEIRVNPTRMELKKLRGKLATARRGHKLLKDKCDELMRQFLDIVREAKVLREEIAKKLSGISSEFRLAAAETDSRMMTEALMLPSADASVEVSEKNIMSVIVPSFKIKSMSASNTGGAPYGYAFTSGEMDKAADSAAAAAHDLIRLAELEKSAQLLCREIERTRRRVNALEYIMIPDYETAIKNISMKLDENERGNLTRLMKVKDMMLKEKLSKEEDF